MTTKTFLLDTSILNNDALFARYYQMVSPFRQQKIRAFKFRKDKNLSLGAGILLDTGLGEFGLRERDVQTVVRENGKPFFPDLPDIHFNISHSETQAICSFSQAEVGADIEKITDIDLQIAKRFFYRTEYAYICAKPLKEEQNEAFFRLWTLKESFMKLSGKGMHLPLDSFEIQFGKKITIRPSVDGSTFFFREYSITGYKTAVCSMQDDFLDPLRVISI